MDLPNSNTEQKSDTISYDYDTIVLSGGGVRGLVLLGSLQCLTDNRLNTNINTYIGTSVGSIISYLMCIGYSPIEIIVYICTNRVFDKIQYFNISDILTGGGVSSFNQIQEQLEILTIQKIGTFITLKDLYTRFNKTLICCTYNLTKDKVEYISHINNPDLPCLVAIRMSSTFPIMYEKYNYNNCFYIDGGIIDNFPIKLGDEIGNRVLGLLLSQECEVLDLNNILDLIYKLLSIPTQQNIIKNNNSVSNKCDIINLEYNKNRMFDLSITSHDKLEMFSEGYKITKNFFNL